MELGRCRRRRPRTSPPSRGSRPCHVGDVVGDGGQALFERDLRREGDVEAVLHSMLLRTSVSAWPSSDRSICRRLTGWANSTRHRGSADERRVVDLPQAGEALSSTCRAPRVGEILDIEFLSNSCTCLSTLAVANESGSDRSVRTTLGKRGIRQHLIRTSQRRRLAIEIERQPDAFIVLAGILFQRLAHVFVDRRLLCAH